MPVPPYDMNNKEGFNASNGTTNPQAALSVETYVLSCFFFAIAIISVLGNVLVILAVYTNRRLQTTSNFLLAALAVPDFFQGAVALPLRLVEVLDEDCDHKTFCRAAIPISTLFGGTSNLHILLIAVERFIAIFWPYFYCTWITTKRASVGVGAAWTSMIIFSLLPVMGWGGKEPDDSVSFCQFSAFLTQGYIASLYIFVHVIPIITVLFLNIFILRASLDHVRRIGAQFVASGFNSQMVGDSESPPDQSKRVRKRMREATMQRKATRTVIAVVGSFILLVIPIVTIDIVEALSGAVVPAWIVKITVLMIYANHCVNVFGYAGLNGDYRKTFLKIVTCKKRLNIAILGHKQSRITTKVAPLSSFNSS